MTDNRIDQRLVADLAIQSGTLAGTISLICHGTHSTAPYEAQVEKIANALRAVLPKPGVRLGRSEAIAAAKTVLQLMLSELEAHP